MIILGLHRDPWHDSGASIIRDDGAEPAIFMVSEERMNRVKDSREFPDRAISACMASAGVESVDEIDLVVVDYIRVQDWRRDSFRRASKGDTILNRIAPEKIHIINHHLAHACSVFFSSTYDDAAILIVDGRGSDNETQTLFVGEGTIIRRVAHTDQIGIGLLYAAVTHAIGFGLLQEGKTMGLAPYGDNGHENMLNLTKKYNGICTDYSDFCVLGNYDLASPVVFDTAEKQARAAWEVQKETEDAMLHLAGYAQKVTGKKRLCISGGVALNSVANYAILKSGLFEDVFINPACSDTGIPLGVALYGYNVIAGRSRLAGPISPFIGPLYDSERITEAVNLAAGSCRIERDKVTEKAADMLAANKIVANFYGRSEIGPRALGNRSILMSPLEAENKSILNHRVKHRESFRPFAPACLEERAAEFFDIDRPVPYMLMVPPVRPEKRSVIPAVTHVDGTGRLQTVSERDNPRFRELIELFADRTGIPVLLNTSFNDNGEPIVESPEDAVRCFLGTNIDALLLQDVLLIKTGVIS